jgi:hypothetical protein
MRVDGNLRILLLDDENRNGKAQSIQQDFHAANHHQIVAVHDVYHDLLTPVQTTWRHVYNSFFGYLFSVCCF